MLSTSTIKNISEAGHYYAAVDNYYTLEEGIQKSEWFGRGAHRLGLQGSVELKPFDALLRGQMPNGEIIGKKVDDKVLHRPGWDLTFSAPKSVSVMALIYGDKRLVEAHRKAVCTALSEVERGCSEVRIKNKNTMTYSHTKNLIGALFHHDLSRAEDPQLHTHSVVMNITERQDGLWRSMASKLGRYGKDTGGEIHGFIERVRHNKRYYGNLYETELAYLVKELGYDIKVDDKTGVFQIEGVTDDLVQHFSKRRNKIKDFMDEHGLKGAKAAEFAALHDREKKQKTDRPILLQKWIEDCKQFGFEGHTLIKKAELNLNKQSSNFVPIKTNILNEIERVIDSIAQFKTTFTMEELIHEASPLMAHHKVDVKKMLQGIDQLIESGNLIQHESAQGRSFLISQKSIVDEQTIMTILSKNLHIKLPKQTIGQDLFNKYSGDNKQQEAVLSAFSTKQHILVEGKKTREIVSRAVSEIAKSAKLNIAIVSPNLISSKEFASDLKQKPDNLWEKIKTFVSVDSIPQYSSLQFINQPPEKTPDILMIDQSHLLSAHEQAKLLEWSQFKNTKLLFFSEKNLLLAQKKSVDSNFLIKHGIQTISIQDSSSFMQTAIENKDFKSIYEKVSAHIIEVKDKDDRMHAMASHYARLNSHHKVYLVAQSKAQATQLNQLTHEQLKMAGRFDQSKLVNILVPHFIPEHLREISSSYAIGDVVRLKIHSNQTEYFKIAYYDKQLNEFSLKGSRNQMIRWKPNKDSEIFKENRREWAIGERLLSHRSLKNLGVVKGEMFTVTGMRNNTVRLSRDNGKSICIDISKAYQTHFDYGYAGTSHQLAHVKADHFIADLTSNSFNTDQRRFFQIVSQPEKVSLYTDDAPQLLDNIHKKTGDKLSSHDILDTTTNVKKQFQAFYQILENSLQPSNDKNPQLFQQAVEAVDYAMRHLSERQAGFSHKELMEVAMTHAMGHVNQKKLLKAINAMEKNGVILRGEGNDGVLWTTQDAIKIEKEIIAITQQDAGQLQPIASDSLIEKHLQKTNLNAEQVGAIKAIVQSQDRVLTIQGRAGTGKTTLMASLSDVLGAQEIWKEAGFQLQGIAPTHKAVNELKSRGIKATTIDQFISNMRNPTQEQIASFPKTVLIIDEASMVSNRKMRDILSLVHSNQFRLAIPTGDSPHQLAAIEAGKPHHLIQQILDEKVIRLEDIRRQKNPVLIEAVKAIYQMNVSKTFSVLGTSIIEIKEKTEKKTDGATNKPIPEKYMDDDASYEKRVLAIAEDYIDLLEKKEDVQIITPSHEDRKAVNEAVRVQLNKNGSLTGNSYTLPILVAKDRTAVERSLAKNFQPGEIVRFTRTISKQLKGGNYFTIQSVDHRLNMLVLNKLGEKSADIVWRIPPSSQRLNKDVEVFRTEKRELKVGDKITWVKTNPQINIQATDTAQVKSIINDNITVVAAHQKELTFNSQNEKYKHWDHGYAITAYGAQGGTYSTILALFESYRKNLMNLKTFLVTLTL